MAEENNTKKKTVKGNRAGKKTDAEGKAKADTPSSSLETLLAVLLIVSIVFNFYLFYKLDTLEKSTGGDTVTTTTLSSSGFTGEKAVIDLFVMSQCPYGAMAGTEVINAVQKLGDAVELNMYYIATEVSGGSFSSLHGQPEVDENIRQLCAIKYYPTKYMNYIHCINENYQNAESIWQSCAQQAGLDATTIKTCSEGVEGQQLLSKNIQKADELGVMGSPTIYVNDVEYSGQRDELSITRSLCNQLSNYSECNDIPECTSDYDCVKEGYEGKCVNSNTGEARCEYSEPTPMKLTVLNDKNCASCDASNVIEVTKQLFLGTVVDEVDVNTAEGQELLEKYNVTLLPAYLFEETVEDKPSFPQVSNALIDLGGAYMIHPQAAGGNYYVGREKKANTLDLFVMSQCPYGTMAETNVQEVLDLFGDKLDFNLYFIASENPDGSFSSLHGQPEVDENIRQLCAIKYYPTKYMNYIHCVNQDYSNAATVWEKCANETGLSVETIKSCAEGSEGKQLLSKNIKLAEELGVGGSPTFLVNNQLQFGGAMPADTIKGYVCDANPDVSGCSTELSSVTGNVATGGSC